VSRWSPKTPRLKSSDPSQAFKDDCQASEMSTGRDDAQGPSQASNTDFETFTNIAECYLPTREIETPKGEVRITVSDLHPSDSQPSKTPKRKLVVSTEETLSMESCTPKLEKTQSRHDE